MTQENFLKSFLADTPEEAEKVYKEFDSTLNNLARSYSKSTGLEKADLFSEALVGLARAKRDFDPTRSSDFKNYALVRVKDAIHNYIRQFSTAVVIPSYVRKSNLTLGRLRHCLLSSDLSPDSVEEILMEGLDCGPCQNLMDTLYGYAERAGLTYTELYDRIVVLPSTDMGSEVDLEDEPSDLDLTSIKESLNEEESEIIDLFLEDKTFEEIGQQMGRSASWVHKKFNSITEKLRGEN